MTDHRRIKEKMDNYTHTQTKSKQQKWQNNWGWFNKIIQPIFVACTCKNSSNENMTEN